MKNRMYRIQELGFEAGIMTKVAEEKRAFDWGSLGTHALAAGAGGLAGYLGSKLAGPPSANYLSDTSTPASEGSESDYMNELMAQYSPEELMAMYQDAYQYPMYYQ